MPLNLVLLWRKVSSYTHARPRTLFNKKKKNIKNQTFFLVAKKLKNKYSQTFSFSMEKEVVLFILFFWCNTLQLIYAHVLLLSSFTFWSLSLPEGPTFPMLAIKEQQVHFYSSPTWLWCQNLATICIAFGSTLPPWSNRNIKHLLLPT